MQTPTLKSITSPQAQPSGPDATPDKKFKAKVATNEQASRPLADGGKQASAIFGAALARQEEKSRLKAELTKTGFQHISATSPMSMTTEKLEISLPAERVDSGWKAKVESRENGQRTQNLAAVRSDETGKWTIMSDKMKAAGQCVSHTRSSRSNEQRYSKSLYNPVQGPYAATRGAEIAAKMLNNIAHLDGEDLIMAGSSSRRGGEVGSAKTILDTIKATKSTSDQVFVYNVSGEPAAVMKGEMRQYYSPARFHISYVVSDPYARGAGTALIEKAVNISLQNGGGGTVTLEAVSGGAIKQYEKLGFSFDPSVESNMFTFPMILDPRNSNLWRVNPEDQYSYFGNGDQKYVTGLGRR